jgi:phage terminase large subunit GpA-like protein
VTSEQLVKVKKDFITTLKWVKKGERNEALDCAVYARAAVAVLKPKYRKIAASLAAAVKRVEEAKKDPETPTIILGEPPKPPPLKPEAAPPRQKRPKQAPRSSFVNSW